MLTLKLARVGRKKQAYFRLIVTEKTKDTWGKSLEILGNFNPHSNPLQAELKTDRIKYWLSKGAQTTPRVHNLLVEQAIIKANKVKVWKPKVKPQTDKPAESASTEKKETPA